MASPIIEGNTVAENILEAGVRGSSSEPKFGVHDDEKLDGEDEVLQKSGFRAPMCILSGCTCIFLSVLVLTLEEAGAKNQCDR